jgi:hypothetical protein
MRKNTCGFGLKAEIFVDRMQKGPIIKKKNGKLNLSKAKNICSFFIRN